jgi:hypothetical protein
MTPLRISQNNFAAQHHRLDARLHAYSLSPRGRRVFTAELRNDLRPASALSLKAINHAARIAFAEGLVTALAASTLNADTDGFYFVTLIVAQHAVPLENAREFDTGQCVDVARRFLDGFDYVGLVEAAFYHNAPFVPEQSGPSVSWHLHAIVWNAEGKKLAERRRQFNQTNRAFLPGCPPAHIRSLSLDDLPSYARYMSKASVSEYTAYPMMRETVDPETGEIVKSPTGKWRNRKRPIRPGNLVRAMSALNSRTLSDLSFGGGEGKALRKNALKSARRALRDAVADRRQRTKKLLFSP